MKRIPSLDGLRCISCLLVVFGHSRLEPYNLNLGNLGVRIFFVISAYLIIGILYKDIKKKQFSIRKFYFKRIMRTFPAYYTYLFITGLFLSFINYFEWNQFWRSIFYLENYHPRGLWTEKQWFVGHSWSLAVEEQFYIISALIFSLFNKKILNKRTLNIIFLSTIIIVPFIKLAYIFGKDFFPKILLQSTGRSFETVADALAVGGIIYLNENKIRSLKIFHFFAKYIYICLVSIIIIEIFRSELIPLELKFEFKIIYYFIGQTLINIIIGTIILTTIKYQPNESFFARVLNNRFSIKIGMMSYSIYLWQQIWLYNWNIHMIVKYLGIILTASISYYFIEKPFLKFRDKLLQRTVY